VEDPERVPDPLAAAAATVCLHATELASIYLSARARSDASRTNIDRALYTERSLVRQMAMRRTVFAFPRDLLPAVLGSAAARVAAQQSARLARDAVAGGLTTDGAAWVEQACVATLDLLRQEPATTAQLRKRLPVLGERLPPPERPGAAPTPVAPRVLLGGPVHPIAEAEGYAELVRRWLWAFGPGTEADIVWWLGATKAAVRRALADLGAVAVRLEDGSPAWLHPEDVAEVRAAEPWAALLPALDPTTMGWRGRSFYVDGPIAATVYDRAGNGKPTAWLDGRIVGGWAQQEDGTVVVLPATRLPRIAITALKHEAAQLTAWLDGNLIRSNFQSPLARGAHDDLIR